MAVTLTYNSGEWVCRCTFDARHIPKDAGFYWNESKKYFYTFDPRVAVKLREYATENAESKLKRLLIEETPWLGGLPVPNDKTLLEWQPGAAMWALTRNRSYLALDPGLGKTPIAITVTNALTEKAEKEKRPAPVVFYVCPPFLTRTVEYEFEEWRTSKTPAMIQISERFLKCIHGFNIVPDSILILPSVKQHLLEYGAQKRREGAEVILIVDEAHRFSNWESQRSQALYGSDPEVIQERNKRNVHAQYVEPGIAEVCDRVILLSGTPMQIRPMELYPVLKSFAPETIDFKGRDPYGETWCQIHYNHFGRKYSAGTEEQMRDLGARIKTRFMYRLRKKLLKLPPKIDEIFVVGRDLPARIKAMEDNILEKFELEDLMRQALAGKIGKDGDALHLTTYRRLLGFEKVAAAAELIEDILETTDESLLVFGIHPDVLERLAEMLFHYSPFLVTGKHTTKDERFGLVKEFQENKARRLWIANSRSSGVGFTLTKASRVLHIEPDWNRAVNEQATDRAHRVGQNASVLNQYVVYRNSLDMKIIKANLRSQKLTKHV